MVFAGMRNLDRGGELREIASKEKLPINIVHLDIDSDNSVEDAFNQILSEKGQIDVLVNNAGIGARGYIEEAPIAVFRQVMETNFFGGLRCIKAVVPSMRERKSGCIINITSVSVKQPIDGLLLSNTVRAGLTGWAKTVSNEVAAQGVTVNNVAPGYTLTERQDELAEGRAKAAGK